jgi:hypothetical protein
MMKKLMVVLFIFFAGAAKAQSYELERLILDIEKLSQLKSILTDLYKGYEILNTGYNTIKNISEGNFNLHDAYLTSLLLVSPAVKNYQRVADIMTSEASIVSEYSSAFNRFKQDSHFSPDEITYLSTVYNNLISATLSSISNLVMVLTDNTLRMSDNERLHQIDGIYNSTKDQLQFLRQFNSSTTILAVQRATESGDISTVKKLYGLP